MRGRRTEEVLLKRTSGDVGEPVALPDTAISLIRRRNGEGKCDE
jgi:hypothetical protein